MDPKIAVAAALIAFLSLPAAAGQCAIRVDRQPMPGKTAEAWGPYGNRNPTVELKPADSADACREAAAKNCEIKRKDILKSKAVNALYDGSPVAAGQDLCK